MLNNRREKVKVRSTTRLMPWLQRGYPFTERKAVILRNLRFTSDTAWRIPDKELVVMEPTKQGVAFAQSGNAWA